MPRTIEVEIQGMTCHACAGHVREALRGVDGVDHVEVPRWQDGRAVLTMMSETIPDRRLLEDSLNGSGYRLAAIREGTSSEVLGEPEGDFDLAVIGTGAAGMAAATEAARRGKKVAIIEKGTTGGTCVNVGCIPSKALIKPANFYWHATHSRFAGVQLAGAQPDWEALLAAREELVARLRTEKYANVLDQFPGITLKRGQASFERNADGFPVLRLAHSGEQIIARRYVVATGARPFVPDLRGANTVGLLDSTSALFLKERPRDMIVIGGGPVAVEIAQAFHRLGVRIESIEARSGLLSAWDPDVAASVTTSLQDEGIPVHHSLPVRFFEEHGRKGVEVRGPSGEVRTIVADEILVAMGRISNSAELGLTDLGIEVDEDSGSIQVNEHLQTAHPAVYAAGDVAAIPKLVYLAAKTGKLAAAHALGDKDAVNDLAVVPEVVFADPQAARVGLTAESAQAAGHAVAVTKLALHHVPRAIVSNRTDGFIKLVADTATDTLVGAHIVSENAGELIQTAAFAVQMGRRYGYTVTDFKDQLFPYLTETEGLRLAAQTFTMSVAELSCCAG